MKLTATQLRRIIAEEVSRLTESRTVTVDVIPHDSTRRMFITLNPGPVPGTVKLQFGSSGSPIILKEVDALRLGAALNEYEYTGGFGVQVTPGADEAPPVSTSMPGRRI
jgi:hypothetical protein